jgi:hypothetical protein
MANMGLDNWERFSNDIEYKLLVSPFGLNHSSLTPKQAREHFEWFISKIPERVEYLTNRCAKDLNITVGELNLSPCSLTLIWKWFLMTARTEKTPENAIIEMENNFGHLGESFINREQFTVATQFILRDIGMYLGEVFTKNCTGITWNYYTAPKRDIFVNQPQLFGFIDASCIPPFKLTFQPIHMVEVQATNVFDKTQQESDLHDLFTKWSKFVVSE